MRTAKPKFTIAELLQQEQFSAFIHKLGHEIGNPLTSIISLASLVERSVDPDLPAPIPQEKLKGYAAAIASEAWRISRMNERLVLICSARANNGDHYTLSSLIRRVVTQWEKRGNHPNVELVLQPAASEIEISADAEQLGWLLTSLIENAALAVIDDQEISSRTLRNEIVISWSMTESDRVTLNVTNERPAAYPLPLESLFEPFVSGGKDRRRLGLGLTAAAAICSRLNGALLIKEDKAGESYNFTVSLSLPTSTQVTEKTEPATSQSTPTTSPTASRWRAKALKLPANSKLYIVEDEHSVGTAIQKILTLVLRDAPGFSAKIVSGADFQALVRGGGSFNAALCDINLGEITGPMIFDTAKNTSPDLLRHLAFLTGDRGNKETQAFLQQSGCRYLHKPFEVDELVELVFHLINGD